MNELYPFQGHYLDLSGLRYHYLDEGQGDAVVMVHGNPTWSFYYRKLVLALRDRYRVVVPDHIGCGLSDKPGDDRYEYTLASRVEDLGKLLDHLKLERITLVLHDWGGMIGMAWAAMHPERIKRLVILNTAAFHLPRSKAFPAALALARLPGVSDVLVRGFNAFSRGATMFCVTRCRMPKNVARGYMAPYDSWQNRIAVHRFVQDIPLKPGDKAYALVSATADKLEAFQKIPMLVCWGMKDFVFDRHFLAEWLRRFPNAEAHRFEDAGHYVLEDAADEIIPLVQRFLEQHPLEETGS